MSKKAVILNASPRKNFNTAKLLKESMRGIEETGAKAEYFDLYDYSFSGCRSCLSCQMKNSKTEGICAIKDDIRPILQKCLDADAIIIGSPIYFSYPTGVFRCFTERLLYPNHTYMVDKENGGLKRRLDKTIPTGIIFTMNCPEQMAKELNYTPILNENLNTYDHIMGHAEILYSYDTMQFADYSKYNCDLFDEKQKIESNKTKFPKDMEKAFELGKKLIEF